MTGHTAAALAAHLTPVQVRALRAAAAGTLHRGVRTSWISGQRGAYTCTVRALSRRDLVELADHVWRPTELGGAVLARLTAQDGAR